ncbi:MFS transporter [Nocardia yamanashiensis]|uniref:MFS transporter n=1 Tax=Nocardia yamanashiensis TaxID=209247 RepID=UPI001471D3C5|nr:MFS transporter [Nocardia yamanashiensis]
MTATATIPGVLTPPEYWQNFHQGGHFCHSWVCGCAIRLNLVIRTEVSGRARLPRPVAFGLAATVIGFCLAASAVPSPIYKLYATTWRLDTSTVTWIYATYCFGVLASLLMLGRVSDAVGRRPVIAAGLAGLTASMVLFACASGVGWLFLARAVQGLSTGIVISAAGAALLELYDGADPARAGLYNVVASSLGVGSGGLVGALLVQYGPSPMVTPFVLLAVLAALLLAGSVLMPETVVSRSGFRITAPGVPRAVLAPFTVAGLAIACAWSIIGLFLGLVGAIVPSLLHTGSYLPAGVAILVMGGAGTAAAISTRQRTPASQIGWGMAIMSAGILLLAVSVTGSGSAAAFLCSGVVIGFGMGSGMFGALRLLGAAAPPDHRAQVIAAFYLVAYAAISLPAIAAGYTARHLGAAPTIQLFGAGIVVVSLATLALARRRARSDTTSAGRSFVASSK